LGGLIVISENGSVENGSGCDVETAKLKFALELTTESNIHCRHCNVESGESSSEELSTARCVKLMAEVAALGADELLLRGGEVFTREDIWLLLEEASRHSFKLSLVTNGIGLEREDVDHLAEFGLSSVDLTVFGDRRPHDSITGEKGAFRATCRTARLLVQNGVSVQVHMPLLKMNLTEHRSVKQVADSWGAVVLVDAPVFCRHGLNVVTSAMQPSDDQLIEFFMRRSQESGGGARGGIVLPEGCKSGTCTAGKSNWFISSVGDVCPCAAWRVPVGNIRDCDLKEVIASSSAKEISEYQWQDQDECVSCRLSRWCSRCPGLLASEEEAGDGPRCRRAKSTGGATVRGFADIEVPT
jgi:radical SAM protein with 4Fe4S-binding SPASM domain